MGWLNGWAKRVKITIDQGDITSALSNFPVLIYLSANSGRNGEDVTFVFDEVGANSLKIAVTEDDGETECYVEVEKWDSGSKKAWLWIKVPAIASDADTDIYLYYDNDHADNTDKVGAPNSAPAENVWDDDFVLVSHMRDDPGTSNVRDSTTNDNDGAKVGAGEPAVTVNGKIDDAQLFDGDNDYIGCGNDATLNPTTAVTFEAWVKPTGDTGTTLTVVNKWDNADRSHRLALGRTSETTWLASFTVVASSTVGAGGSTTLNINTEYYVVGTYDGNKVRIYVNGVEENDPSNTGNIRTTASPLAIGIELNSTVPWRFFYGIIDEVRVSKNLARNGAWIKASYESGRDHLNDFGSEEESGPPATAVTIEYKVVFGE